MEWGPKRGAPGRFFITWFGRGRAARLSGWYIDIATTILDIIHRAVFYLKLNSIGLSVPHRKQFTSPL
jgi:hypothetical protein